jgi:hypothetical protein
VEVGDRRLQDVRACAAQRRGALEQRAALGDLLVVPQRAILLVEQDELVVANRAWRRESLMSISPRSASTSDSSGMSVASTRPSRIASEARSIRPVPQPWLNTR